MNIVKTFAFVAIIVFLTACQKQTYDLAETPPPADAPEYTVEPDLNRPGMQ